jgi:DNA repair protein RadC
MTLDLTTLPSVSPTQLGDSELLALALDRSMTTAALLLTRFGGVAGLARAPAHELVRARMTPRQARQLHAVLELGRRSLARPLAVGESLDGPERVIAWMRARLGSREQEEVHVLGLDAKKRLIGEHLVAMGTIDQVFIDPRDVFRPLVRENACAAIVVHNHPSGDCTPSPEDRVLTRTLVHAGELLGIQIVDHLIVAREGAYSFAGHKEI